MSVRITEHLANRLLDCARATGSVETARTMAGIDRKTWEGIQLTVHAGHGSRSERRLVSEILQESGRHDR